MSIFFLLFVKIFIIIYTIYFNVSSMNFVFMRVKTFSVTKVSDSEDKSLPSLTREPPISHRRLPVPQSEA